MVAGESRYDGVVTTNNIEVMRPERAAATRSILALSTELRSSEMSEFNNKNMIGQEEDQELIKIRLTTNDHYVSNDMEEEDDQGI